MYQSISQVSSVPYFFLSKYELALRIWSTKKLVSQNSPRWSSGSEPRFCSDCPGFEAAPSREKKGGRGKEEEEGGGVVLK